MSGKFEPKTPVQLNPPKSDPISLEELAKADGKQTKSRSMASHAVQRERSRLHFRLH